MIVTKHSAEALASLNLAVSLTDFVTRMEVKAPVEAVVLRTRAEKFRMS
jgi:hypothetical protein